MDKVSEAMVKIADLAILLGIENIKELPGCWEYQLSEDWWFALNGHNETRKTTNGLKVLPYNCIVEFKGFPIGYFSPFEGIFASGKEDDFIEAIDLRIKDKQCI